MNTMWCEKCGQDVPGVSSGEGGKFRCPRCGEALRAACSVRADQATQDHAQPSADGPGVDPPPYDDWEVDQQLEHIGRVLGSVGAGELKAAYQRELARLDPAHAMPDKLHLPPAGKAPRRSRHRATRSPATLAALTWAALLLGTTTLVCGGVLLGWSLVTGREELWTVGLPVALCGQIALLVGLLLRLDRLWQDGRQAAAKLDDVDERLRELKTTTTMLGTGYNSPSSAFYSHLVDGAGPQLLLSDLKSQLDLLALKLSNRE